MAAPSRLLTPGGAAHSGGTLTLAAQSLTKARAMAQAFPGWLLIKAAAFGPLAGHKEEAEGSRTLAPGSCQPSFSPSTSKLEMGKGLPGGKWRQGKVEVKSTGSGIRQTWIEFKFQCF